MFTSFQISTRVLQIQNLSASSQEFSMDSSLPNSTPRDLLSGRERLRLEREERATARLQCRCQRDRERRRSEQAEVSQARLERRRERDHERREAERSEARQSRLERPRECDHERREAECLIHVEPA